MGSHPVSCGDSFTEALAVFCFNRGAGACVIEGGADLAVSFLWNGNPIRCNKVNRVPRWRPAELLDHVHVLDRKPLPPEVLERRCAQLRVSSRVLDRSMAEPILNAPRIVAGIGHRASKVI
jgi:hypothetical protein